MALTSRTRSRVVKAYQRLCNALEAARREHSAPVMLYVGDGQPVVVDSDRMEDMLQDDFADGGAVLIDLPIPKVPWDGGGW